MIRLLMSVVFISLLIGCQTLSAPQQIQVSYLGNTFMIPPNPSVVAALGVEADILLVRYGDAAGQNYISFTEFNKDRAIDFGCSDRKFLESLIVAPQISSCNQAEAQVFKSVFIDDRDVGRWSRNGLTAYYSIAPDTSFVFLIDASGNTVQIESDFLTKDELNKLL